MRSKQHENFIVYSSNHGILCLKFSEQYLCSLHDSFSFRVEVEISPQGLEKNRGADAHLLTVHLCKLMDSVKKKNITFQFSISTVHLI